MHTSLIFKNLYLNQYSTAIDFKSRLQKQVPVRPHFVPHDFDHRYLLYIHLYWTDDSTYTQNTLRHIISGVAILGFWRCVRLHSDGKDEPVWLGMVLRYQPPKLSWRRRQHDGFRSLVFWFNVIFPTLLTFSGDLCCSQYAMVRLLRPVTTSCLLLYVLGCLEGNDEMRVLLKISVVHV